jgi:DNA-binding CsgD family transcriptional regulator
VADNRTVLIGREGELTILRDRLDRGQPIALLGEAGVGKTTLVRAAAERAGRRLVEAGALATLSWLPYLPLRRAFAHDFEGDAAYVASTVESELGDAVLFVDDVQWADAQTASLLPVLAARLPLIAALRRGDPDTSAALDAVTAAGLELLPLEPLPDPEAAALAHALHPGLSETATKRLIDRSGGNPFLLEQLAVTGEPSDSLRLTVAARLRGLTPAGHDAIAGLALLGRPAPPEFLGPGTREIVEAGLASANGEVAIRHALLAEATTDMLEEKERSRIHSRLAAALDDPGEAARHHAAAGESVLALEKALLAAERAPTPGERAAHLGVAAANADGVQGESLRLEAARTLLTVAEYRQALELVGSLHPADADGAAEAALLRSQAYSGLVRVDDADRELADAVAMDTTNVRLRIRIAAHRASVALRNAEYDAAIALGEEGLRLAESGDVDGPELVGLYSALAGGRRLTGSPGATEAHGQALAAARRAGAPELELRALSSLAFDVLLEGDPAQADALASEAIARARSLRLLAYERRFRAWHAGFNWHLGLPAVAAAEAEAVLADAVAPTDRELVEPYWWFAMSDLGKGETVRAQLEARVANAPPDDDGLGDTLWAFAELELAAGRPGAAERVTRTYFDRFGRASAFVGIVRAWAQFELGTVPTEIEGADLPLVEGAPVEFEALAALARGGAADAAAAFDRAAALWEGRHVRGDFRCRWAAAESLRRAGQLDEARDRLLLIEPAVERRQLNVLLRKIRRSLRLTGVHRAVERTSAGILTGREADVLVLVAEGLTNDEIARRLGLGRPTVVRLIRSAQQKLGAKSRTQAAALAARP